MDRRMLPGLGAGAAGVVMAVAAAVIPSWPLALAAGACAVVAGAWCLLLAQQLGRSEAEAANAVDLVTLRHLELFTGGNRSIVDTSTGLPDHRFFELALDGRVAAARRHLWPVTLVLVELGITALPGDEHADAEALASFSVLLRRTLREADIACRLEGLRFAILLEDTTEEGGVWTAERLQIGLSRDRGRIHRLSAGVASYPTHAMRADELMVRADTALARAMALDPDHGLGPVEVAPVDLV